MQSHIYIYIAFNNLVLHSLLISLARQKSVNVTQGSLIPSNLPI